MADDADIADAQIANTITDALARARLALAAPSLTPIVQELDGVRFGVCHYCESPIRPGGLFCPPDPEPEHSCSVEWERERVRRKAAGL
jgi:hypothetical protein